MSRKIKFRAWEKLEDKYYYDAEHTYDFQCEGKGCYIEHFGEVLDNPYRFEVEQYTGLKDKNGKEIYEGDIITVMGYGTYIVFWREWDSSFSLKPIDTVKEETRVLMLCGDWESDYEVIGNIHENPELLEVKK